MSEPGGAGETDGLSAAAVPGLISKRDKSGQLWEPSGPDEEARVYDGMTETNAVLAGAQTTPVVSDYLFIFCIPSRER